MVWNVTKVHKGHYAQNNPLSYIYLLSFTRPFLLELKREGYSHHMSFPLIFRCMQVPEGPRHFALRLNVQIGTEAYPGVQGAFFPGKIGGGVNLTTYLRLVPR